MESISQAPDSGSLTNSSRSVTPEARLQLAAIVDSSDDAIISKDLNGIITSWNAAATTLFGYTPEEIVGKSVLTLIPHNLHSEEPEILRKVRSGERIEHYETRRLRKNGELLDISLTISPIKDATGRIVGISKIARDITERKRTEAALIESERLAAIGRMAAAIAHEVNNPLEAILNLAYLLSENSSLNEEAVHFANLMLKEVLRLSEITKKTLSFYRDASTAGEVNLKAVLESVLSLHRPLIQQKSIRVSTQYGESAYALARAGELQQVFANLVTNAIDALSVDGEIKVKIWAASNGDRVCITIADTGSGVPSDIRKKIFQPFFSTKQSQGTGLGLWISQSIVQKYGGSIRMRTSTTPGKSGTVFRICLPARS